MGSLEGLLEFLSLVDVSVDSLQTVDVSLGVQVDLIQASSVDLTASHLMVLLLEEYSHSVQVDLIVQVSLVVLIALHLMVLLLEVYLHFAQAHLIVLIIQDLILVLVDSMQTALMELLIYVAVVLIALDSLDYLLVLLISIMEM